MNTLTLKKTVSVSLFDILALVFVYFVPALSHLTGIPLYLAEPMRIVLILALVHTSKNNAFILALTLPVFSIIVSGHPEPIKMLLIIIELTINVGLYYYLSNKIKNKFFSILFSIIISKLIYYLFKFGCIYFTLINSELFSTPLYIQLVTTVIYSTYVFLICNKHNKV